MEIRTIGELIKSTRELLEGLLEVETNESIRLARQIERMDDL
ncbi:hypothetical protein [Marinobacter sp.]|nr:hypothetical protein [Marinobacter sp.]